MFILVSRILIALEITCITSRSLETTHITSRFFGHVKEKKILPVYFQDHYVCMNLNKLIYLTCTLLCNYFLSIVVKYKHLFNIICLIILHRRLNMIGVISDV
jgi:hypothetical protein